MSYDININIEKLNEETIDKIINLLIDLRLYSLTVVKMKLDGSDKDKLPETSSAMMDSIKYRIKDSSFDSLDFIYKFTTGPNSRTTDDAIKKARNSLIDFVNCKLIKNISIMVSDSCEYIRNIADTRGIDMGNIEQYYKRTSTEDIC